MFILLLKEKSQRYGDYSGAKIKFFTGSEECNIECGASQNKM